MKKRAARKRHQSRVVEILYINRLAKFYDGVRRSVLLAKVFMNRQFYTRSAARRTTLLVLSLILTCAFAGNAFADDAARVLTDKLGDFRAVSSAQDVNSSPHEPLNFADHRIVRGAARTYTASVNNRAEKLNVSFWQMQNDSSAYAFLTRSLALLRNSSGGGEAQMLGDIGTLGYALPDRVQFFKGSSFVVVDGGSAPDVRLRLARELSGKMLAGDGEIPPLALSLPEWERVRNQVVYAVSKSALADVTGRQAALDAVDFNGGAEAATAVYGGARLVILEYNTPQIASENDRRVAALGESGNAATSAYKRVGNYLVFVFDAADKGAATRLLERVKYEQVVRWLGDNPRALLEAQKAYGNTIATVIIGTVQGAGIALLLSLCVGGAVGSFVFSRRRARHTASMAFSDAGGIVRLNIDELTSSVGNDKLLPASNGSGGENKKAS